MAVHRAHADDHPLLTARHVDNLTDAVRALTVQISRANELLQQGIRLIAQGVKIPPMPEPPPRPSPSAVTSARATMNPQRRRSPR